MSQELVRKRGNDLVEKKMIWLEMIWLRSVNFTTFDSPSTASLSLYKKRSKSKRKYHTSKIKQKRQKERDLNLSGFVTGETGLSSRLWAVNGSFTQKNCKKTYKYNNKNDKNLPKVHILC